MRFIEGNCSSTTTCESNRARHPADSIDAAETRPFPSFGKSDLFRVVLASSLRKAYVVPESASKCEERLSAASALSVLECENVERS
jgi:hypothetical protein